MHGGMGDAIRHTRTYSIDAHTTMIAVIATPQGQKGRYTTALRGRERAHAVWLLQLLARAKGLDRHQRERSQASRTIFLPRMLISYEVAWREMRARDDCSPDLHRGTPLHLSTR
jgi:hypothetical protein